MGRKRGAEKERERNEQLVHLASAKVKEACVFLEEKSRQEKVEGHAEERYGFLERLALDSPGACDVMPNYQHNAKALGQIDKGVAWLCIR